MDETPQDDGSYFLLTHEGKEKGPYTVTELRQMWAQGEIGGRAPIRSTSTGEDSYLDQVAAPPTASEVEAAKGKGEVRQSKRTTYVVLGCLLFLGVGGTFAAAVYQDRLKMAELKKQHGEFQEILDRNYQIVQMYLADWDDTLPPEDFMYTSAPFSGYQVDGQGYTESATHWHVISLNSAISGKSVSSFRSPETTMLFSVEGLWYRDQMPLMTLDGKMHIVDQSTFVEDCYSGTSCTDVSSLIKPTSR